MEPCIHTDKWTIVHAVIVLLTATVTGLTTWLVREKRKELRNGHVRPEDGPKPWDSHLKHHKDAGEPPR